MSHVVVDFHVKNIWTERENTFNTDWIAVNKV